MTKKFITFKSLTGVFKETMEPYQRMTEKGEMSPLLEVDGNNYRILRTTVNGLMPRKMVVCREDGQIEESEEITLKCFQFYLHLTYYSLGKKNIYFDATQGGKSRHEPLIQAFQTMVTDLTPVLSPEEQEAMEFHLHYLEEIYRLSILLADSANDLIAYWKQVEKINVDKLSSKQMSEISDMIIGHGRSRDQLDGILFEDGERARATVQMILKSREYKRQISNRIDLNKVLKEMKGATDATKRFIKVFLKNYEPIEMTLEIDTGPFSMKKLIDELYSGLRAEQIDQLNVKNLMKENWILSSDCIYINRI